MDPSSKARPESLIRDQDWVRPLVQRLVRDEASAEDVLQSTWLRSLRNPPRAEKGSLSWRGWFLRVARNLASREGERETARKQREARAARGESLPSMLEISEREELRAKIVAHVLALPDPYRTTLVLRFYEGLAPRAIARAQQVNGSTVRNRIARGLTLLRERLEREQGTDWVSSCLAVLPLVSAQWLGVQAGWTSWAGWIAKGGVVAKQIEIATAAAVVVAAGVAWIAWPAQDRADELEGGRGGEAALSKEDPAFVPPPASTGTGAELEDAQAEARLESAATQRRPADAAGSAAAGADVRVFGTVRDARGAAINQSGGTFRMQMGSATARAEQLVLTIESLRADRLSPKIGEYEARLDVKADEERASAYEKLVADKVLRSLVLRGSTRIVFADSEGCQFQADTDMESRYSAEGLHAGKWRAIVTHDGKLCRRQEFEIEPGEKVHKLDLTLDDALSVRVRMRTPDGRELVQAVAADPELAKHVTLSPVALRPGSVGRFLPDGDGQDFGSGTSQPRAELGLNALAQIGEASGVLTITEAPPLEIGLVLCGQLIARQPLAPGQEEVEFVLSLEDLRRAFTTVVVRVIDAQTHAPIAGAGVSIDGVRTEVQSMQARFTEAVLQAQTKAFDRQRAEQDRAVEELRAAAQGPITDGDGIAHIAWVTPGTRRVFVSIHSHAPFSGRFEISAGPTCELPTIELTGHARINGRIRGPQGELVSARLQLVPLERFEETHEDLAGCVWQSNEQGVFEIPNQRRERYVLRMCEGEHGFVPLVVDTSEGDVRDLELRVVVPGRATLSFTREPKEGAQLRISTSGGLPVLERDLSGLAPADLSVAPGTYVAEVREGKRKAGSERFVVGREPVRAVLVLD